MVEFSSIEVNGDYPLTFNKGPFSYTWTETEELIIEKSKKRMAERLKTEKMMPRERIAKGWFTDEPIDRVPRGDLVYSNVFTRTLDSFNLPPPIITNKDILNHPNLAFIGLCLYEVRFLNDVCCFSPASYGEEVLTKKFRSVEYGPPLMVEPFAKTKEDLEFFDKNLPDPASRGLTPLTIWWVKQQVKHWGPMFPVRFEACSGPLASAGFLLGIKEFLLALRKQPDLADAALKAGTDLLKLRLDRLIEATGGDALDETGKGNICMYCDGAGAYVTSEEFARIWPYSYGEALRHTDEKGWPTFIGLVAPIDHYKTMAKAIQETEMGGGYVIGDETPPLEPGIELSAQHDKVIMMPYIASRITLNGPEEAIRNEFKRIARSLAKTTKGKKAIIDFGPDAQTPLAHIDYHIKAHLDLLKYPVTEP